MKVMVFLIDAQGHINPALALVKELVGRGEDVICYTFGEYKKNILDTGAKFRTYNVILPGRQSSALSYFLPKMFYSLMEMDYHILKNILDNVKNEKPDYIIHDSLCVWGKHIAGILKIPAISSITLFAMSDKMFKNAKQIFFIRFLFYFLGLNYTLKGTAFKRKIEKEFNVKFDKKEGLIDTFMNKECLNIVYTYKEFQPFADQFEDSYKFVGPSFSKRIEKDDVVISGADKQPLVYISLGTVNFLNIGFYHKCMKALAGLDLQVILSVGKKIDLSIFKQIPSNFTVKNFVAQLEILQKADLFITHGGMNSVHEGIYYGVPIICVPQTNEQKLVSSQVEKADAGIFLRRVTPVSIKNSVLKILGDESFRDSSIKFREYLKSAGGAARAADEIKSMVNKRYKLNLNPFETG